MFVEDTLGSFDEALLDDVMVMDYEDEEEAEDDDEDTEGTSDDE